MAFSEKSESSAQTLRKADRPVPTSGNFGSPCSVSRHGDEAKGTAENSSGNAELLPKVVDQVRV